jgi:hypothetical protein
MSEETKDHTHDATEVPKLKFGFAIVVSETGDVFLERNTQVLNIPVEREASMLEIRRYISEILIDLQAQSAAEYVALKLSALAPKEEAKPTE